MRPKETHKSANILNEETSGYGFVNKSEIEKLKEDIYRPDKEKLQLFIKMLRRNATLNKAVIKNHNAQ